MHLRNVHLFLLTFLYLYVGNLYAQKNNTKDTLSVYTLIARADELAAVGRIDSALKINSTAVEQSRKLKFERGEGYAVLKKAELLFKQSENKEAIHYDSLALKIALQLNDGPLLAAVYHQMGLHASYFSKHEEAVALFEKSLKSAYELEQSSNTASVYNSMGQAFMEMGDFENQMLWQTKALTLYEKLDDDDGIAQTLNNIAGLYYELGKKQEAIMYGKRAVVIRERIGNYDELSTTYNNLSQIYLFADSFQQAQHYGELGLKFAGLSGSKNKLAHAYTSMVLLMNRQRKNNEALGYEKKAIAILEQTGDNVMLSRRYISAAILSSSKEVNDSAGAVSFYNKAINLATRINSRMNIRDGYYFRSAFFNNYKDYAKALDDYKKHILYRDSLVSLETSSKIADIETKYETEKKDLEIERLKTEQRIRQLEIEKQKAVITGNLSLAKQKESEINLLMQQQELQDLRLKEKDKELEKQLLVTRNDQQQLKLAQQEKELQDKQIQAQKQLRNLLIAGALLILILAVVLFNRFQIKKKLEEQVHLQEMRNSISRNLHDDIGASLSNINILTELARRNATDPDKAKEYLSKAADDIQHVSESLSDIVWNINPRYDELNNLFVRMKRYAADMMDGKNISYEMNFPEDASEVKLGMDQRRDLYLIFKEAVNNMVKYSRATNAKVEVLISPNSMKLLVKDNGGGFDMNEVKEGNGLRNMQQRAALLKASLTVESEPGKGTTVNLDMPLG
ncbi:tetratricopeptide repeat-containing sensor histidine kinase [Lacibacter sediminis]|uniref:histidine kinase n=1 Tax=Lacibacter sediminis TaxID=2760713 RepID=A0A7G5XCU8_9BACT|nr:tetratricopeptide repeat-containing sensor histidine kinase [Lacibacter sediminis]QNA43301.1 tetratricopeptide repeat protein [Lacibacter sediminis]